MCIGNCFIKTVYTCVIHFRILCFTCWATRFSWCRTEHDGAALSPRCCWRSDTCPRQIPTLPSHQQPQLGSRFQTAGLGGSWITHTHTLFFLFQDHLIFTFFSLCWTADITCFCFRRNLISSIRKNSTRQNKMQSIILYRNGSSV